MGGLTNLYPPSAGLASGDVISNAYALENAATNLLTQSADFSNAAWTKLNVAVTANAALAPNGLMEADKLQDNSVVAAGQVLQGSAIPATALSYVFSCYISAVAPVSPQVRLQLLLTGGTVQNMFADIDPTTGVIIATLSPFVTVTPVVIPNAIGKTTWFRVAIAINTNLGNNVATCTIIPDQQTVSGQRAVLVWGAQLETQSNAETTAVPTSQIPTLAAPVARTVNQIPPWILPSGSGNPAIPVAGGAGTILRSDGANWQVSQTTYPDLVASKQVLVASAANTVASFANFKYDDTAAAGLILNNLLDISGAAGGQVKFPATQNPSANANTLDDYEEGTWTPTDGSGAGLTLTTVSANYTKVGRNVTISAFVTYPATASGAASKISGLPFTTVDTLAAPLRTGVAAAFVIEIASGGTSYTMETNTAVGVTNVQLSTSSVITGFTYPTT